MSAGPSKDRWLERLLAAALLHGTWLATAVIAAGLIVALAQASVHPHSAAGGAGNHIIGAGIALLILLPVLRVVLMLAGFVRRREYRFSLIAALVLTIIAMGVVLGMRTARTGSRAERPGAAPESGAERHRTS